MIEKKPKGFFFIIDKMAGAPWAHGGILILSRERRTQTMMNTNTLIDTIKKMDDTLLMTTDDNTYNNWLAILGDYYKDAAVGFRVFVKDRLTTNYWNTLKDFYNRTTKK